MAPEIFIALVVAVADGDTLTVLRDHQQIKIRLAEIDAPEKKQPFGERSKQSLAALCFQVEATIKATTKDRYGRTIARIECRGQNANAAQVRTGMAWAYDKYLTDPSIKALENEARAARRGLWTDPYPIPPWDWRHPPR